MILGGDDAPRFGIARLGIVSRPATLVVLVCNVFIYDACCNSLGIAIRKPVPGPELRMVESFISHYVEMASRKGWARDVAIFVEPKVGNGYPDLVIAHYDSRIAESWAERRLTLKAVDLKVLSCLANGYGNSEKTISRALGFEDATVRSSLRLLGACGMAIEHDRVWQVAKRSSFLAAKKIIAIEAKVNKADEVLGQAFRDSAFSTESYALLGSRISNAGTLKRYERLGVGVIESDTNDVVLAPKRKTLPICLSTLTINEWLCRKVALGS